MCFGIEALLYYPLIFPTIVSIYICVLILMTTNHTCLRIQGLRCYSLILSIFSFYNLMYMIICKLVSVNTHDYQRYVFENSRTAVLSFHLLNIFIYLHMCFKEFVSPNIELAQHWDNQYWENHYVVYMCFEISMDMPSQNVYISNVLAYHEHFSPTCSMH